MRINVEYLGEFLNVFLNTETAFIDLSFIKSSGVQIESSDGKSFDECFLFHLGLAIDNGLLGNRQGLASCLKDVGVSITINGDGILVNAPLRLSQKGHDFANALQNKDVVEKLKTGFKEASFKVLFESSQKLLEHYLEKKLDAIMSD